MFDKDHKLLVVTDLDSSLLDEDYAYKGAIEALNVLEERGFPLVLNSSKTYSELRGLAVELSQCDAVIAENGGLVAVREKASLAMLQGEPDTFGFVTRCYGKPRDTIIESAHRLRQNEDYAFEGFADWTVKQVVERTGLDEASAELAMERETTEPILWNGNLREMENFIEKLKSDGIKALRGGRFIHLMGMVDKEQGMQSVVELYKRAEPFTDWVVVAVGDSANDKAMLEAADLAVVIPHATGPMIYPENSKTIVATHPGSKGWGQAILKILNQI